MNNNTIKILKSSNAVIIVLVLALLAQMPHAQYVLYSHSRELDWFGLLVTTIGAIALEMAVLVFAVRGNVQVSWGFAAFSTCVNLVYYYDTSASLWTPTNWLLSIGLPVAIALYSHEVMEPNTEQCTEHKPQPKRVTRTVRATQTVEQSEQFDDTPEQYTIVQDSHSTPNTVQLPAPNTVLPTELDLSTLTIEQKQAYAIAQYKNNPKLNKSALGKQLSVGRTTLYAWFDAVKIS